MEIEISIRISKQDAYSSSTIAHSATKRNVVCDNDDYRRVGRVARDTVDDAMNDVADQLQALTRRAADAEVER